MRPEDHDIIVIPESVYLEAAITDAERLLGLCVFCAQPTGNADTACNTCQNENYGE